MIRLINVQLTAKVNRMFRNTYLILAFLVLFFVQSNSLSAQPVLEIWEIQGEGLVSPVVEEIVWSENNVVTAVGFDRFYIQTPTNRSDNDPNTSDGIIVFTGSFPNVSVGDIVSVKARIKEFDELTEFSAFSQEIIVESGGGSLPPPIELDQNFPSGAPQSIPDLEKVEGMRVSFQGISTGPGLNNNLVPVVASNNRPFTEAGILFPGQSGLPIWDGNPEIFWMDPNGLGEPEVDNFSALTGITATGVISQDDDRYLFLPEDYELNPPPLTRAVRNAFSSEFTIGSFNIQQLFFNSDNYTIRIEKTARYIVELLKTPDVLAIQEIGSFSVLADINDKIEEFAPGTNYDLRLINGNDDIDLAYMVSPRVLNPTYTQLGKNLDMSTGNTLHDRPPLLLEAELDTEPPTPIKVLAIHMRSRIGISDVDSNFVRLKRFEQSVSVAEMIQDLQGPNLFVIGDFNALPFSDGLVDITNQLSGNPSLGAQFPVEDIVDPPLTNLADNISDQEKYSFIFNGNAELVDQCLRSDLQGLEVADFQYARGNADNPTDYSTNANIPHRTSDHDAFVVFVRQPGSGPSATISPGLVEDIIFQNPAPANQTLIIDNKGQQELDLSIWTNTGQALAHYNISSGLNEIHLPQAGIYLLEWKNKDQIYTSKLVVY